MRLAASGRANLLLALALREERRTTELAEFVLYFDGSEPVRYAIQPTNFEEKFVASREDTRAKKVDPPRVNHLQSPLPLKLEGQWHVSSQRIPSSEIKELATSQPIDAAAAQVALPKLQQQNQEAQYHYRAHQPIIPFSRLIPKLQPFVSTSRRTGVDVPKLIQQIVKGQWPKHLPRKRQDGWSARLVVLIDYSKRLEPYRNDFNTLAARLIALCGSSNITIRYLDDGPFGPWSNWEHELNAYEELRIPKEMPWSVGLDGSTVLVISDLLCPFEAPPKNEATNNAPTNNPWFRFAGELKKRQIKPVALCPIDASQITDELGAAFTLIRWSEDSPLRAERYPCLQPGRPEALQALKLMAMMAWRVPPALLRRLRKANPYLPNCVGLESALWQARPVLYASSWFHDESQAKQQELLNKFSNLTEEIQQLTRTIIKEFRGSSELITNAIEANRWLGHMSSSEEISGRVAADKADSTNGFNLLIERLAALEHPTSNQKEQAAWFTSFVWHYLFTVSKEAAELNREPLHNALNHLLEPQTTANPPLSLPVWVQQDLLKSSRHPQVPPKSWATLAYDVQQNTFVLTPQLGRGQIPLHEPFEVSNKRALLREQGESVLPIVELDTDQKPLKEKFALKKTFSLEGSDQQLTLHWLSRPLGISGWGRDAEGLFIRLPLWGNQEQLLRPPQLKVTVDPAPLNPQQAPLHKQSVVTEESQWMGSGETAHYHYRTGIDLAHGAYLDFSIDKQIQRFRYIELGEFLIGSSADDPNAHEDEKPQHSVRITKGFWLADTACTQALWQAVMGNNPSHFQDADNWQGFTELPVEQISYKDVQQFLSKLTKCLPAGLEAVLPNEAQWEFACRAGTTGPYWWGSQPDVTKMNFDQSENKRTKPVKTYDPNPWGLFQMHGNLWEWCADDLRTYPLTLNAEALENPEGSKEAADRALRGGSWDDSAQCARSAYRDQCLVEFGWRSYGFRFALRSIEPSGRPKGGK